MKNIEIFAQGEGMTVQECTHENVTDYGFFTVCEDCKGISA